MEIWAHLIFKIIWNWSPPVGTWCGTAEVHVGVSQTLRLQIWQAYVHSDREETEQEWSTLTSCHSYSCQEGKRCNYHGTFLKLNSLSNVPSQDSICLNREKVTISFITLDAIKKHLWALIWTCQMTEENYAPSVLHFLCQGSPQTRLKSYLVCGSSQRDNLLFGD